MLEMDGKILGMYRTHPVHVYRTVPKLSDVQNYYSYDIHHKIHIDN